MRTERKRDQLIFSGILSSPWQQSFSNSFFLPDILNFQLSRNNIRISNQIAGSLLQERTITFVKQESYFEQNIENDIGGRICHSFRHLFSHTAVQIVSPLPLPKDSLSCSCFSLSVLNLISLRLQLKAPTNLDFSLVAFIPSQTQPHTYLLKDKPDYIISS